MMASSSNSSSQNGLGGLLRSVGCTRRANHVVLVVGLMAWIAGSLVGGHRVLQSATDYYATAANAYDSCSTTTQTNDPHNLHISVLPLLPWEDETKEKSARFCVRWSEDDANNSNGTTLLDEWWTHHIEYVLEKANNTHLCLQLDDVASHKYLYKLRLYLNQFHTTCDRIHRRFMWSSGWGEFLYSSLI
jgi:hypothetical protein